MMFFGNLAAARVAKEMRTWPGNRPRRSFTGDLCMSPREALDRYFGPLSQGGRGSTRRGLGAGGVFEAPGGPGVRAAKLLRACGGCLGARRRRRARKTAISSGEPSNGR